MAVIKHDQRRRLARILVLGKASAHDHADHSLPQHLLMTAVDGVRGVPTTRSCSQLDLLACKGVERDLLHANSVPSRSDALPLTPKKESPRVGRLAGRWWAFRLPWRRPE